MGKLLAALIFLFIGSTMLSAIMEGGGGVLAVELSQDILAGNTTIPVSSTTDFLDSDYIYIGNEKIAYSGKTSTTFTGCSRGVAGTTATAHSAESMVYTDGASVVNDALGFSVEATADSMGWWATLTIPFKLLFHTIPRILVMNYSFLVGTLGVIGYFIAGTWGASLILVIALSLAEGRRV